MKKPIAPCLVCTDRFAECHSTCEKYKQYEDDKKEYKQWLSKERQKAYVPRNFGTTRRKHGRS